MIRCPALDELYEPIFRQEYAKGYEECIKKQIRKKLLKNEPAEIIAMELEEDDLDKIRRLIDEISREEISDTVTVN